MMRIAVVITLQLVASLASAQDKSSNGAGELRVTYLGQAGYEIADNRTVILVDPVISMMKLRRDTSPGTLDLAKELHSVLTPDTEAIDARIKRADYILISHGHYDHLLDA